MNNGVDDLFNFKDYVLFLKDKLDNTEDSQVVGVHGDYGAGKTTTMNLVKKLYLEDQSGIDNILEFSAWRSYYNNENTVWKALLYELSLKIYEIFVKIGENDDFKFKNISFLDKKDKIIKLGKEVSKEIQFNLYQNLKEFNEELEKGDSEVEKNKMISLLKSVYALLKNDPSGLFNLLKKEEQNLLKPKIDSLEVIQRKFDILLEFYNLIEIEEKKVPPLIIMVDDLDRILPEKSVEILEILRIFFEKSHKIHFICAIDIRVIEKGIERKFNQLDKGGDLSRIEFEEYLEKIITIPFDLPAIPLVNFDETNIIFGIDKLIDENINKKDEGLSNQIKKYNIKIDNNTDINIETQIKDKINKQIKQEQEQIKKINKFYFDNIKSINNNDFKEILKTGLQANPRKIKRFIDIFEVYFKILIYRINKNNLINNIDVKFNEIEKYSCLLAKMLIIKLEWDEVYREFVNDKLYLVYLENIVNNLGKDESNLSYKLEKFIKNSKRYKIANLFGMLNIGEKFQVEDSIKLLQNIYIVFYLIPNISNNKDEINKNENIGNIGFFNLLKYLYEYDENKVNFYINNSLIQFDSEKIKKVLDNYLKLIESNENK